MIDEFGIRSDELRPNEIPGYQALVDSVRNNTLSVDKVKGSILLMKSTVEADLNKFESAPQTWVSLLTLFIPFLGVIRKWYQDQHTLYLQARLKNLSMICDIFTNAERVQQELERQINNLRKAQTAENERRGI